MSSRLVRPLDAKSVVCVGRRLTILSAAEHRVDVQDIALCKIRFRQGGPLRGPEDLGLRWPPTAQERPHPPKQFNLHRLGRAGQIADHLLQRSHALSPDSGFLRIHLRTNVLSISSTLRLRFFLSLPRMSPRFASVTAAMPNSIPVRRDDQQRGKVCASAKNTNPDPNRCGVSHIGSP
jgi:hypothetical protein